MNSEKSKTLTISLGDFVVRDEKVRKIYESDNYFLILTDSRVILKRLFPNSLNSFFYKDIDVVEYYERPDWNLFVISLLSFAAAYVFSMLESNVLVVLSSLQSVMISFSFAMFVIGSIEAVRFFLSLSPKLMFRLKFRQKSVQFPFKDSKNVSDVIYFVEKRIQEFARKNQGKASSRKKRRKNG